MSFQQCGGESLPPTLPPPPPVDTDNATYRIQFNATWSASTHPEDFPRGAHFSPLIGAVHDSTVQFWAIGATATAGIEQMAETGATSILTQEISGRDPGRRTSGYSGIRHR